MNKKKINYLTNLQDARVCAALGINWISFCLERGNDYKVTPGLIKEIYPWIEGTQIILDYGNDFEAYKDNLHFFSDLTLIYQLNYSENIIDFDNFKGILKADSIEQLIYSANKSSVSSIEINFYNQELIEFINPQNKVNERLILNFDYFSTPIIQNLLGKIMGISSRKKVELDLHNLDYDLLDSFIQI